MGKEFLPGPDGKKYDGDYLSLSGQMEGSMMRDGKMGNSIEEEFI